MPDPVSATPYGMAGKQWQRTLAPTPACRARRWVASPTRSSCPGWQGSEIPTWHLLALAVNLRLVVVQAIPKTLMVQKLRLVLSMQSILYGLMLQNYRQMQQAVEETLALFVLFGYEPYGHLPI